MFHIELSLAQAGYITRPSSGLPGPGRLWFPRDRHVPAPAAGAVIRVSRENEIELVESPPGCGEPPGAITAASTLVFPTVDCLQGWLRRFARAA